MTSISLTFNPLSTLRVENEATGKPLRFHTRAPVPGRGLQEREVIAAHDPEVFELLTRLAAARSSNASLELEPTQIDRLVELGLLVARESVPRRVELLPTDDPRLVPLLPPQELGLSSPLLVSSGRSWTLVGQQAPPSSLIESVRAHGYAVLPRILGGVDLARVRCYVRRLVEEGFLRMGDPQSVRYVGHNEPLARLIHEALAPWVGQLVGTPVKPSYCYLATYLSGSSLDEHTDRPQCEYSITLNLDTDPPLTRSSSWPIWIRNAAGRAVPIRLAMGEGLFYRGCERPHFREPLQNAQQATSVFLHYVDAAFDGPLD